MAKKRIIRQERYKKGTPGKKDVILRFINQPDTIINIVETGSYEDGKEFIIIKIDNI